MKESILVGTRGWERPEWNGPFYPDDLPPDWRFCYFSNRIRSVLVPAEVIESASAGEARQWVEDSDPAFGFVLELTPRLADRARLELLEATISPIVAQVRGVLLRLAPADTRDPALPALLRALAGRFPLCVDAGAEPAQESLLQFLANVDAGLCWRPDLSPSPQSGGTLMVGLSEEGAPRAQRGLLEQLAAWQGERGARAGIFFDGTKAPALAEQARVIAELMMV